jgi:hypothetical protein
MTNLPEQPNPARHERLATISEHAGHIADSLIPAIIAQYSDASVIAELKRLQLIFTAFADGRHLDSSSLHDMSQAIAVVKKFANQIHLPELDLILSTIRLATKQNDDASNLIASETFTAQHRTPNQQEQALAAAAPSVAA